MHRLAHVIPAIFLNYLLRYNRIIRRRVSQTAPHKNFGNKSFFVLRLCYVCARVLAFVQQTLVFSELLNVGGPQKHRNSISAVPMHREFYNPCVWWRYLNIIDDGLFARVRSREQHTRLHTHVVCVRREPVVRSRRRWTEQRIRFKVRARN
jgi:hypothetical protein